MSNQLSILILLVVFILSVLKISNLIDWSWFVVLFPLVLTGSFILLMFIFTSLFKTKVRNE